MIDVIPSKSGIYVQDGEHTYCIRPPIFSLWNYHHLRGRSVITGFIGARGSGKSVGAARTLILDYLLCGYKNIWSNMDISISLMHNGQKIVLRSKPLEKLSLVDLDKVYHNGVIYVDEVSMTMAETRRSMAQVNLQFSYILQQLRKRHLNLLWSCQSEMNCDERLRFATDVFVMCKDVSIANPKCGIGELSHWTAYDMTGLIKGESPNKAKDAVFYEGVIWNKPWWNAFDTWQLQGIEADSTQSNQIAPQPDSNKNEIAITKVVSDVVKDIITSGICEVENKQFLEMIANRDNSIDVGLSETDNLIKTVMRRNRYAQYHYKQGIKIWTFSK